MVWKATSKTGDYAIVTEGPVAQVTRRVWRDLLIYPALISLGAVLVACAGPWAYPPPQTSAVHSQAWESSPPSARPTRKSKSPVVTDVSAPVAGSQALARTEPVSPVPVSDSAFAVPPSGSAASSPPGASAPTNPSPLRASELIGLDQARATRLLGATAEQFEQPPALVWRYTKGTCQLDLFFYLELSSNQMRTLHYTLKGSGGDTASGQECVQSLRLAGSH